MIATLIVEGRRPAHFLRVAAKNGTLFVQATMALADPSDYRNEANRLTGYINQVVRGEQQFLDGASPSPSPAPARVPAPAPAPARVPAPGPGRNRPGVLTAPDSHDGGRLRRRSLSRFAVQLVPVLSGLSTPMRCRTFQFTSDESEVAALLTAGDMTGPRTASTPKTTTAFESPPLSAKPLSLPTFPAGTGRRSDVRYVLWELFAVHEVVPVGQGQRAPDHTVRPVQVFVGVLHDRVRQVCCFAKQVVDVIQ